MWGLSRVTEIGMGVITILKPSIWKWGRDMPGHRWLLAQWMGIYSQRRYASACQCENACVHCQNFTAVGVVYNKGRDLTPDEKLTALNDTWLPCGKLWTNKYILYSIPFLMEKVWQTKVQYVHLWPHSQKIRK